MSRLTVRLPESLHEQLTQQAEREGVSLNQYILFSLARAVTVADLTAQKQTFEKLTQRFPAKKAEASLKEILGERT